MSDPVEERNVLGYVVFEGWQADTATDIGPHLSCAEAEDLAFVFGLAGRDDLAEALIESHLASDAVDDDHFKVLG